MNKKKHDVSIFLFWELALSNLHRKRPKSQQTVYIHQYSWQSPQKQILKSVKFFICSEWPNVPCNPVGRSSSARLSHAFSVCCWGRVVSHHCQHCSGSYWMYWDNLFHIFMKRCAMNLLNKSFLKFSTLSSSLPPTLLSVFSLHMLLCSLTGIEILQFIFVYTLRDQISHIFLWTRSI